MMKKHNSSSVEFIGAQGRQFNAHFPSAGLAADPQVKEKQVAIAPN